MFAGNTLHHHCGTAAFYVISVVHVINDVCTFYCENGPTRLDLCNCKGSSGRSSISQTTTLKVEIPTYYSANFAGKMHESERYKTEEPFMTPLDPPLDTVVSTLLELVTRLSVKDRNLDDLATDL